MPPPRHIAVALLLALGPLSACATAQAPAPVDSTDAAPAAQSAPAAADSPVAGVPIPAADAATAGPDVFLLPDESGKLRRVLGYRYEDFLKAWQAGNDALRNVERPKFSVTETTLNIDVGSDTASVKAVIKVELQAAGSIDVPLQMSSLICDLVQIQGGDEKEFVQFALEGNQYEAWLKGQPGDARTIVMEGRIAVERQGQARRLSLKLPPAFACEIKATGPPGLEVESPPGVLSTTTPAEGDRETINVAGAKGEFILRWGSAESDAAMAAVGLEALVNAKLGVEPRRLSYEAFIGISGMETPIDRFRVRLPKGTTPSLPIKAETYEVTPVIDAGVQDRGIVEVRFREATVEPPVVRIPVEQSPSATATGPILVEPFEVLGVFRQRGFVAVHVSDQLHSHFEPRGRIDQIEIGELPEAVRGVAPMAGFSAAGAEWRLEIHTQPRRRKVRVTPSLEMHLGSQGALLDVQLDFQISGGRAFELRIDLEDWELTEQPIESGGAVDLAEQHVTADHVLILPLKDADVQQVRLRFGLRREAGLGFHDLPLPVVQDAAVLPGNLILSCDEGWQANAQIENSMGVSAAEELPLNGPATEQVASTAPGGALPVQRLQTFLPQVRVAIDVSELDRVVDVDSTVNARVNSNRIDVEQQLQYEVRNQPATELVATVPTPLLANEGLELSLDGKALPGASVDVQPLMPEDEAELESRLRLVVRLPQPKLGKTTLTIRSSIELNRQQIAGASNIVLLLATPEERANVTASVRTVGGERVATLASPGASNSWTATSGESAAQSLSPTLLAVASEPVTELALRLKPMPSPEAPPPDVVRVLASWAQTWLAGDARQDRFVFRLESNGSHVVVQLPPSIGNASLEVLVDGQLATVDRPEEGRLVVALPSDSAKSSHTLELRRHTRQRFGSWGEIAVGIPRLEGNNGGGAFFWHVVLPREIVPLRAPAGAGAEYVIGWDGMSWGRQPTQSQAELERWTDSVTAPAPSGSTSAYLYSAFEPPAELKIAAVRRLWLVVAGALPLLGLGMMWLHTSFGRSPRFLLMVAVAVAVALLLYPEAASLLVQAAVLGAIFSSVSALTKWLLADVPMVRRSGGGPASSVMSLAPTQAWAAPESPDGPPPSRPAASSLHPSGSAR